MAEMDEVPVGHAAIDGRILAHRRDDDAVGEARPPTSSGVNSADMGRA